MGQSDCHRSGPPRCSRVTAAIRLTCVPSRTQSRPLSSMPAKWQQWMPFHIDRFKGSSSVQAMHPSARCGYLYLLTAAWQSDDCSIPTDPMELSELSALGDELWSQFGPRILRKFIPGAEGRLTNGVLRKEWEEAKRVFEARQASAERTNTDR